MKVFTSMPSTRSFSPAGISWISRTIAAYSFTELSFCPRRGRVCGVGSRLTFIPLTCPASSEYADTTSFSRNSQFCSRYAAQLKHCRSTANSSSDANALLLFASCTVSKPSARNCAAFLLKLSTSSSNTAACSSTRPCFFRLSGPNTRAHTAVTPPACAITAPSAGFSVVSAVTSSATFFSFSRYLAHAPAS